MGDTLDRAQWITMAAVVLGVLGDLLLRDAGAGINVGLWGAAFLTALLFLARRQKVELARETPGVFALVLVLLTFWGWRASPMLRAGTLLAVLSLLAIATWRVAGRTRRVGRVIDYVEQAATTALNGCFGAPVLLAIDISWSRVRGAWVRPLLRTSVGCLLSLALMLVFVPLLASADQVFSAGIEDFFALLLNFNLPAHLLFVALFTWLAAGALRDQLLPQPAGFLAFSRPPGAGLGMLELGIPLGALAGLFLAFLVIQLRYLFGGAALVAVRPGLTYADYARRGFFELVAVAALVVPLLLFADWVLLRKQPRDSWIFRAFGAALVGMLLVMLYSAAERMRLYVEAYGWTELRFYTSVAMAWLAFLLVALGPTLLAGRRDRFPFVALASALVVLAALHVVNPDAWIVRANARLAASGRPFDAVYAVKLSSDAIPALVEALPALPPAAREAARRLVVQGRQAQLERGWRAWSWSRFAAGRALESLP